MSSFFFSTSLTLLLLSTLSFSSTAYLVDIDGFPIRNGGDYYIVRGLSSTSSGLTYTQKEKECPLFITKETTENSPGTPVTISSPARTLYISLGESVSFTFKGPATPCGNSLEWGTSIDAWARKLYITVGGESSTVAAYPFSITKRDRSLLPTYELMYGVMGPASYVGFFEDGFLGLTQYPTTVSFKKASDDDNVLKLPTSN